MNEVFDYVSYVDKKEIVFYSSENDFSNTNIVKDSRQGEIEVAMEEYKLRIESNVIKQTIHVSTSKLIPSLIVGDYVHLPNFDVASDAFNTLKELLTTPKNKLISSDFLDKNYNHVISKYEVYDNS